MRVSELLNKYGSDKESYHKYGTAFYDLAFLPFRFRAPAVLEVGVYYGSSLKAWKEYFGGHSIIHGVDNNPKETLIEGCEVFTEDAYNPEFVDQEIDIYDIIIDDGPHGLKNQLKFLELYWNKVFDGGLLIIEDIETDADLQALNAFRPIDFSVHTINMGGAPNSTIAVWAR